MMMMRFLVGEASSGLSLTIMALVALSSYSSYCCAFVVNHHHHHSTTPTTNRLRTTTPSSINTNINIININTKSTTTTTTALFAALSERQLQFWEDVEDGLDDIEDFYVKKYNQDIARIRTFAKRARGELPLPTPLVDGQEPSEEHVDGLTAQPFWNVTDNAQLFPWAVPLEEQAHIIIQEFETKLQQQRDQQQEQQDQQQQQLFSADSVWQNQVMGQGWSAIRLQRLGTWNSEICQEFPQTYRLLQRLNIPLAVRGVCFARQAPGTGVLPHSDGRNFILTSHLGLKIPSNCWIQVGNDNNRRTWQVGKLLTLDTSFVHSTRNDSPNNKEDDRHVLIIDFWHPELTEAEREALTFIYDLRNQFESGQVPIRKPKRKSSSSMPQQQQQQQQEEKAGGLGGWWKSLLVAGGGGNNDDDDKEK